jgi:hypothetical protein
MIDATRETVFPFAEAARRLPSLRDGRPVNISTLWRWSTKGLRAPDGAIVKLEIIRLGGRVCTSEEALARFFARLTPQQDHTPPQAPRTAGQRRRSSERAARKLDRAGI